MEKMFLHINPWQKKILRNIIVMKQLKIYFNLNKMELN